MERLFFPQSQKCGGGTSKGWDWMGLDGIGMDGRGREWSGSSFRSRRNVAAELPKDGTGWDWTGSEWTGGDGSGAALLSAVAEM